MFYSDYLDPLFKCAVKMVAKAITILTNTSNLIYLENVYL